MNKKLTAVIAAATLLTALDATAAVKFRLGFDAATNQYALYMTPDAVPSPDLTLSAQATVVVPHSVNGQRFEITQITSHIANAEWVNHSRVDAPSENTAADYLSLGYYFTGSSVPSFGWQAGQEKKILSFTSNLGCVSGVKLIDAQDPFAVLPNSAGTNPGNDFLNLGWQMSNAYTGNLGTAIQCSLASQCKDPYLKTQITTLENLKRNSPDYMQPIYDTRINGILQDSRCQ